MSLLSVILPAYNEESAIPAVNQTLCGLLDHEKIEYEIIFVDDGSSDDSWKLIRQAHEENPRIKGIHFSRNFGKEAAIMAGLCKAAGDCVAVMDADLQHPPETLLSMYRLWQEGYEVIEGRKKNRGKESLFYGAGAGLFYKLMSYATGINMDRSSDFKLLDKKAVNAILSMPEKSSFFRAMSSWVGFKTASVDFDVRDRTAGKTKWRKRALFKYAISNIVSYSALPMQIVTGAGFVILFMALVMGIQTLVRYFRGSSVEGFTTVILLILLIGSTIMISLGIIGYYIARIFEEVKGRPRYLISEEIR